MTLLELCEPLFLKVCELNRMARLGQSPDYGQTRTDIKKLLDDIHKGICPRTNGEAENAAEQVRTQAKKLDKALVYFLDSMIASSKLDFAGVWNANRLESEKYDGEAVGDEYFYKLLKDTLSDTTEEASERLAVFYVCLGLGFVGAPVGGVKELREFMAQIRARIGHFMDVDLKGRLCPDAYNNVDTTNLIPAESNPLVLVGILFAFLCVSTLIAYVGMYISATHELAAAVTSILNP